MDRGAERSRRRAAALGLSAGLLLLMLQGLTLMDAVDDGLSPTPLEAAAALTPGVVWIAAALLVRRLPAHGTAVLLLLAATVAVGSLPSLPRSLVAVWPDGYEPWSRLFRDGPVVLASLLVFLTGVGAGIGAWFGSRPDAWRAEGAVPRWVIVPIALASLHVVSSSGPVGSFVAIVVVIGGTVVLLQLRRGIAGVVLLAVAVPELMTLAAQIDRALRAGEESAVSPVVVVAMLGTVAVVVIGAWWLKQGETGRTAGSAAMPPDQGRI